MGKRVVVFSTEDPEHVHAIVPREERPADAPSDGDSKEE